MRGSGVQGFRGSEVQGFRGLGFRVRGPLLMFLRVAVLRGGLRLRWVAGFRVVQLFIVVLKGVGLFGFGKAWNGWLYACFPDARQTFMHVFGASLQLGL